MIQAIVFLPLLGAILAGLIAIFGAHSRNPSGDEMDHAHGHDDHHATAHAADGHDDHGHGPVEPAAAGSRLAELITTGFLFASMALSWVVLVNVGFMHNDARILVAPWIES